MPIYEFQCAKCGQVTEALLKFSDKPLRKCPQCGGKLSKLMSMNSFQLKGGGWYVTDYAHKSDSAASTGKSAANAAPAGSSSGSAAEVASATKKDAKTPKAPKSTGD
jgi:putative FmdB family regulatory protein